MHLWKASTAACVPLGSCFILAAKRPAASCTYSDPGAQAISSQAVFNWRQKASQDWPAALDGFPDHSRAHLTGRQGTV